MKGKAEKVWAHCMVQPDSSIAWSAPTHTPTHHPLFFFKIIFPHTLCFCPTSITYYPHCCSPFRSCVKRGNQGFTCDSSLVWMKQRRVDLIFATKHKVYECERGIKHEQEIWRRDGRKETGVSNRYAEHRGLLKHIFLRPIICGQFVCVHCFVSFQRTVNLWRQSWSR